MSLKAGKEALLRKHYTEAIAILTEYAQSSRDRQSKDYVQSQIWLISAYKKTGRADKAIAICEQIANHPDPQLQAWAQKSLVSLQALLEAPVDDRIQRNVDVASVIKSDPRRYRKNNVTLSLAPAYGYGLVAAILLTIALFIGLQFLIGYGISFIFTPVFTQAWFNASKLNGFWQSSPCRMAYCRVSRLSEWRRPRCRFPLEDHTRHRWRRRW